MVERGVKLYVLPSVAVSDHPEGGRLLHQLEDVQREVIVLSIEDAVLRYVVLQDELQVRLVCFEHTSLALTPAKSVTSLQVFRRRVADLE